ncbi:urea transporter (plasmid) [Hafnia alvei]|uniref:urea transporter n=1 Tax=Hafnia alvei TaxID=569 RepID=UPI000C9FBA54|nr:urea transporter [Hafnia alvei]MBI0278614.1 urea transporter [Hafnia alvei]PNL03909.1 urea transporter [Hafnia alvei]
MAISSASLQKLYGFNKYIILEFFDTSLRGCAQVLFQNNPLTGLFFFIAIFIGAYAEQIPAVAWGCLIATLVATLTGYLINNDRESLRAGLYGYNGCLVGAALPTFLAATPAMWASIIFGSIVSVIITICITKLLKNLHVAALTAPFVLTTWVILLSSYAFSHLSGTGLPQVALPQQLNTHHIQAFLYAPSDWLSIFDGISEVFLLSNAVSGILLLIGLAIESIWSAVFALIGSCLALLAAIWLGGDSQSITTGMYSFSAVLTAIALGAIFNKPSWRILGYSILGIFFTLFIQAAFNTALEPLGIPTLTMPFVLASWFFLVPIKSDIA